MDNNLIEENKYDKKMDIFLDKFINFIDMRLKDKLDVEISHFAKILIDEENKTLKLRHDQDLLKIGKLESEKFQLENKLKDLLGNLSNLEEKNKQLIEAEHKIEELNKNIIYWKSKNEEIENELDREIRKNKDKILKFESEENDSKIKFENMKNKVEELESILKNKENDIEVIKVKNKNLIIDNTKLQIDKNKIEKELSEHNNIYSDFDKLYSCYKKLPDDIKINLQTLFGKEDSIISIVCNITKPRNIESFWQFISDKIDRNELTDQIDNLKEIFDISFKLLQLGDSNYIRLEPKKGDVMDNLTMRKILNSPQNGYVQDILLCGFKFQANNRVIKQSLVSLGLSRIGVAMNKL